MKYKVGDKVVVQDYEWEITKIYDETYEGKATLNKNLISTFNDSHIDFYERKESLDLETTILNLNELNTSKTRKLERLMKFIAKDYSITHDLGYDLIRETLMEELRDEDLVNEIMYHVRKGK
jgi:hypothetical protein